MGQRLVITVEADNKPQMKIYYHWSGYTTSTFKELEKIYNAIRPLKEAGATTDQMLLAIIRTLERSEDEVGKAFNTGWALTGGIGFFNKEHQDDIDSDASKIENEEMNFICNRFENETFSKLSNRNMGLVYMSPDGMDDVDKWGEGFATIDLDKWTYINDAYSMYEGKKDFLNGNTYYYDDDRQEREIEQEYDDMDEYEGDGLELFENSLDKLSENSKIVSSLLGDGVVSYGFKDKNGKVYEGIG